MPKTIKELPEHSRPREKLRDKGAAALTDEELVAAILGMGTAGIDVRTMARQVAGFIREYRPVLDASATAFASHFKSLVRDQTVPEGIPFAVPYDKIKPPVPKSVQRIRGKLNVPRERFWLTDAGEYRVAKPV